uniref:Uncharacterized protein n=1 Tax=Anguilla anguilla TaxID=7936 RepID=A0A0E9WGY0_ANGAN
MKPFSVTNMQQQRKSEMGQTLLHCTVWI